MTYPATTLGRVAPCPKPRPIADDDYDNLNGVLADHKRLAAERFRRIWQLVEDIARFPGKSRKELAAQFSLSERQVQADLNVIRREMELPLVRRLWGVGYSFTGHFVDAQHTDVMKTRESKGPSEVAAMQAVVDDISRTR